MMTSEFGKFKELCVAAKSRMKGLKDNSRKLFKNANWPTLNVWVKGELINNLDLIEDMPIDPDTKMYKDDEIAHGVKYVRLKGGQEVPVEYVDPWIRTGTMDKEMERRIGGTNFKQYLMFGFETDYESQNLYELKINVDDFVGAVFGGKMHLDIPYPYYVGEMVYPSVYKMVALTDQQESSLSREIEKSYTSIINQVLLGET